MSSGYFPVYPSDQGMGTKLVGARKLIEQAIESWHDSMCYLNAEDAARDQSYVDNLYAAIGKIDECLRVDESDLAAVQAQLALAQKAQERAEEQVDKWQGIASKLRGQQFADGVVGGIKQLVEGAP